MGANEQDSRYCYRFLNLPPPCFCWLASATWDPFHPPSRHRHLKIRDFHGPIPPPPWCRLGLMAALTQVRYHLPHTPPHTFSVTFLQLWSCQLHGRVTLNHDSSSFAQSPKRGQALAPTSSHFPCAVLKAPVSQEVITYWGSPSGSAVKNPPANVGGAGFYPWVRKIPWGRKWQPTPVFLPGESHGQRVRYSPWGRKRGGHKLATNQQQLINWGWMK